MTPERLRALVFELPDVAEEAHPYGTFYRVRGHLIAKVPGDSRTASFLVGKETARARKRLDPGINLRFWPKFRSLLASTPIGINIRLDSLSDDEARELLREAWRLVPPTWLSPPDYGGGI